MPKKQETAIATLPVPVELIERRIHVIRGHKVMLDSDLAELYQVPTKALNQAVRRNVHRPRQLGEGIGRAPEAAGTSPRRRRHSQPPICCGAGVALAVALAG